jgi:hypothetical protein
MYMCYQVHCHWFLEATVYAAVWFSGLLQWETEMGQLELLPPPPIIIIIIIIIISWIRQTCFYFVTNIMKGFEVLTAVSTKMAVSWVVASCSLVNFYQTTQRYNPGDSNLNILKASLQFSAFCHVLKPMNWVRNSFTSESILQFYFSFVGSSFNPIIF